MEAVAYHKEPHLLAHPAFELVDMIYIADHLATEMGVKGTDAQELDLTYLARVGIDETQLSGMRVAATKTAGITKGDSA